MHAFLIIGNTKEAIERELASRISAWHISAWDTISMPPEGVIGIDAVRDFERALSLTPTNSPAKVGVITDMERLTADAQHAILKTIEEPPRDTYIIGTTCIPEALLPTIRSRMTPVKLRDAHVSADPAVTKLLHTLLRQNPGERLATLEPYIASRDEAKIFLVSLIAAAHDELVHPDAIPPKKIIQLIKNLLAAQSQLLVNVNQRLVIDNSVLHIV